MNEWGGPVMLDSLKRKDRKSVEILVIGAGPAGSVAAALLRQQGRQVLVIEREQFPRFSIGESLLPQSMEFTLAIRHPVKDSHSSWNPPSKFLVNE